MPGQKCIIFKGKRLAGQTVCLFDGPPQDYTKTTYSRGVADVCNKMKFPEPRDCKVLVAQDIIVAEIPFQKILGLYNLFRFTDPVPANNTPEKAWAALQLLPESSVVNPLSNVFRFNFIFLITSPVFGIWTAQSARNTQGMIMPSALINPSWISDPDINFFVAFNSPVVVGAPSWASVECELGSFLFNAGPQEFPLDKSVFSVGDYRLHFLVNPMNFTYAEFLQLPVYLNPQQRGFGYSDMNAFNLRLIVRRGSESFKVCWPEELLDTATCAAVVDTESGLVVGPGIKIIQGG